MLLLAAPIAFAQNEIPCYIDHMYAKRIAEDPEILDIKERVDRELNNAAKYIDMESRGGVTIIPVVFHVIHRNGPENISKEQIQDAIRALNEDFRLQNDDASDIDPVFQSRAADAQIEFRLATKDPQGNCTDGIVRVYSELTVDANDDVKDLSRWPNQKYMNVWVVETIENDDPESGGTILGYAYYPDVVTWGSDRDGIVIRADRVGTIGLSNGDGRTLPHEVGHYLGLPHTFEGGCNGGDGISDTPPTAEPNYGCNTNLNSCSNDSPNTKDNVQNHMDYSYCRRMFTSGQASKMNSTFGFYRNTLVSSGNLSATGALVSPAPVCNPVAEFTLSSDQVCMGNTITFTDQSWNGDPTQWSWSFPGGTPSTSNDPSPTVTYNSPGTYDVTLTVSNTSGSDSETKTSQVFVNGEAEFVSQLYQESFEDNNFFGDYWSVVNITGGGTWQHYPNASYSGNASVRMSSFNGTDGAMDELISPSYDLSATTDTKMTFKYAYAQKSSESSDKLRVLFTVNCGETWMLRWAKTGAALATVDPQTSPFTPNSQSQWEEATVSIPSVIYNSDNVRFKFEFTEGGGNILYIDDINLGTPVGIEEISKESLGLALYPNPTNGISTLFFDLPENETIDIYATDLVGRRIELIQNSSLSAGQHQVEIAKSDLGAAGVYMLTLQGENFTVVEKLVVY